MKSTRYTVIGAGHGGKSMAAHLALMDFEVTLYNRTPEQVEMIKARGGIALESYETGPRGFGQLSLVTSDIRQALENTDVIMVVVPAFAHRDVAISVAPHLKDEQIIILHPGRTLGALEFQQTLWEQGCEAQVFIAETQTFIYASRSDGPAQGRIFRIKDAVPLAALPAINTAHVLDVITTAYPQFVDGDNILTTGLNNIGGIFHPTITMLNAGWIESTSGDFQFYLDGVTPSVARIMEVIDRERVTVASSLGVRATTAKEWLKMAYNATGENLHEAIHNQPGYRGINAPSSFNNRYLTEDIPMSLVPIASLGQHFGVSVRGMDSIIRLACIAHMTDYWRRGRMIEKLGIAHLSVSELTKFVNEGKRENLYY